MRILDFIFWLAVGIFFLYCLETRAQDTPIKVKSLETVKRDTIPIWIVYIDTLSVFKGAKFDPGDIPLSLLAHKGYIIMDVSESVWAMPRIIGYLNRNKQQIPIGWKVIGHY